MWRDLRTSRNGCRLPKSPLRNRLLPKGGREGSWGWSLESVSRGRARSRRRSALATIVGDERPADLAAAEWRMVRRGEAIRGPGGAAARRCPTFVNGMAQAVFASGTAELRQPRAVGRDRTSTATATARRTASTSTSRARVRPTPTASRSRSSTRTARTTRVAPTSTTGRSTTRSASRRRADPRAPDFNAGNTSPQISTRYEATWCRAASPSCTPSRPARATPTGCPNSGAPIETTGATAVIDWLNGRAKGYTTKAGTDEVNAYWTTGNVGDDGHVLQRHDPDRRRHDGRRGPEGDRPDLGHLGLVRLLPRQRRRRARTGHGRLSRARISTS